MTHRVLQVLPELTPYGLERVVGALVTIANPLSVMEAMAAGLPAVVTAVGGVPELIETGRQGWVVPPSDCGAFGAALMQLAENGSMRGSMGAAAVARARSKFGQERMVQSYESLYEDLLWRRARAGKNHASALAT